MATPDDSGSAQEASGVRAAFSLDTFFWPDKRKYHAFGCGNPIKNTVACDTISLESKLCIN
ncbi:MAG: hypothetical protein Q8Q40_08840 [Methylococcaceae bacterium]|nr:hypothetical protein [Methylococcaceae bacterium]